jgi:uncharacterized protein HemX
MSEKTEKVSALPMITVIAISAAALLTLSIVATTQHRQAETTAENSAAGAREKRDAQTAAVMRREGEAGQIKQARTQAEQAKAYRESPQSIELQRLEADDRRWLAEHPLSPTPPRAAAR